MLCYVFSSVGCWPILRANEVIPQFKNHINFKYEYLNIGIRRILYGLFLKVVLADNIAPLVDLFSTDNNSLSAIDIWTLSFLFSFQIYFDFSAYSHIAIGSAKLLELPFQKILIFLMFHHLQKNFGKDGTFHYQVDRDYLYLPIAGVKFQKNSIGGLPVEVHQDHRNKIKSLFITWSIMGLWHGANWTFLIWGLYHAIIIFSYRLIYKIKINISDIQKNNWFIFYTSIGYDLLDTF